PPQQCRQSPPRQQSHRSRSSADGSLQEDRRRPTLASPSFDSPWFASVLAILPRNRQRILIFLGPMYHATALGSRQSPFNDLERSDAYLCPVFSVLDVKVGRVMILEKEHNPDAVNDRHNR